MLKEAGADVVLKDQDPMGEAGSLFFHLFFNPREAVRCSRGHTHERLHPEVGLPTKCRVVWFRLKT